MTESEIQKRFCESQTNKEKFVVIYTTENWSGEMVWVEWGGVYSDFASCCNKLQPKRGVVFHLKTGWGMDIFTALALYNAETTINTIVYPIWKPEGGCFYDTREEWFIRIGEPIPPDNEGRG